MVCNLQVLLQAPARQMKVSLPFSFTRAYKLVSPGCKRGFHPAHCCGCWKLVLTVEKAWPSLPVSLKFQCLFVFMYKIQNPQRVLCVGMMKALVAVMEIGFFMSLTLQPEQCIFFYCFVWSSALSPTRLSTSIQFVFCF